MNNRTWVEISTGAIVKNLKNYEKLLPEETMLMAVVKANAYGHDMNICADAAILAGADYLSVFEIADAIELRKNHKEIPILVLKQIYAEEIDTAIKYNLDITVSSIPVLKKIVEHKDVSKLLINLKIDTGLSRQGFLPEELDQVLAVLHKTENVNIVSLYSHLIGAESKKFDSYTKSQRQEIINWQESFNEAGYYPLVHISATAGFLMNKDLAFDMVRTGIGMYGLWSSSEVQKLHSKKLVLTPALSWKTTVVQVKDIKKGNAVAYDATFIAKSDMKIAVLPVGYYDGLPRALSNTGYILVGGKKCKILGRVMMNMCVVDITGLKTVKMGDTATIIGKQGTNTITAEDMAIWADTINYEIVTKINASMPRIAIK